MDANAVTPSGNTIDFPAYGLTAFDGVCWVDSFEGLPDQPPWALWLGHREQAAAGGMRVGTLPHERYTTTMCPHGDDPLEDVAFAGAFGLVNLTLPDSSVPRPEGLIPKLSQHAEKQAAQYPRWPVVDWDVDGTSVQASVWHFAGGWSGFTAVHDDVYLVVIGIDRDPESVSLAEVTDLGSYGVDLAGPLDLTELGRYKRARPEACLLPPGRDNLHSDQITLLRAEDTP